MVLNEDLPFHSAAPEVKQAFSGGFPQKLLLHPGLQLYKFSQYDLFRDGKATAWWSSVEPMNNFDTGLEKLLERAEGTGRSQTEFARARNAVTHQWNSMSGLLLTSLMSPVYAFVGRVAAQPYDERSAYSNVVFIGGAVQLWIPNLTTSDIRKL